MSVVGIFKSIVSICLVVRPGVYVLLEKGEKNTGSRHSKKKIRINHFSGT